MSAGEVQCGRSPPSSPCSGVFTTGGVLSVSVKLLESGPASGGTAGQENCFLRLRGWFQARQDDGGDVVPAPRPRGDGPCRMPEDGTSRACRPRRRARPGRLLPAPAGMDLAWATRESFSSATPRARGDGPIYVAPVTGANACSPHPQGWAPDPHVIGVVAHLLPTRAGMDPQRGITHSAVPSAPRSRGDGPAGLDVIFTARLCSPCSRGWPREDVLAVHEDRRLPACAGIGPPTRAGRR